MYLAGYVDAAGQKPVDFLTWPNARGVNSFRAYAKLFQQGAPTQTVRAELNDKAAQRRWGGFA